MRKVRPLAQSDKAAWLQLWSGYLKFYKAELSDKQSELTWNRLLDDSYNSFGLVVEVDGKVLGLTHYSFQTSTWAEKDYCYLEDLFVDLNTRGQGLGRALIDAVRDIAIANGSSRIYWNTDRTNETARKLYDSYSQESGKIQYRIALAKSDQD
jgi:GNAT superfamily N-acetyltransferase